MRGGEAAKATVEGSPVSSTAVNGEEHVVDTETSPDDAAEWPYDWRKQLRRDNEAPCFSSGGISLTHCRRSPFDLKPVHLCSYGLQDASLLLVSPPRLAVFGVFFTLKLESRSAPTEYIVRPHLPDGARTHMGTYCSFMGFSSLRGLLIRRNKTKGLNERVAQAKATPASTRRQDNINTPAHFIR